MGTEEMTAFRGAPSMAIDAPAVEKFGLETAMVGNSGDLRRARLTDRGVVRVDGPGAEAFLQGLVTNDVMAVSATEARFGGLLSPQGKIQFAFHIARDGDGLLLDVTAASAEALTKRLMFYRLRAPVTVENLSASWAVVAQWSRAPNAAGNSELPAPQPEAGTAFLDPRCAELGTRWIAPNDAVDGQLSSEDAGLSAYHAHRIGHGVPEAGLDYALGDAFPHEADWDLLGGVDFAKGCYVGQEVVSRMRHRGTVRQRAVPVLGERDLPESGTEVRAGDVPLGFLGSTDGPRGIALLRLDRLERATADDVAVMACDVPIALRPVPWLTVPLPGDSRLAS